MNWLPSDQLGFAVVSISSRPMRVGMRPALNCTPLPLAVGRVGGGGAGGGGGGGGDGGGGVGGCRALRREQAWHHQQTRKHDGAHQISSGWGSKAGSAGTATGCSSMTTTVAASGVLV